MNWPGNSSCFETSGLDWTGLHCTVVHCSAEGGGVQVRLEALPRLHCIAPHLYLDHGAASLHPPTVLHQRLHDLVDQAGVHYVDVEAEEVGGGAAHADQWLGQRHAPAVRRTAAPTSRG